MVVFCSGLPALKADRVLLDRLSVFQKTIFFECLANELHAIKFDVVEVYKSLSLLSENHFNAFSEFGRK